MTLSQLEYIIALDTYRHFGIAAGKCFVTQPSLSMQIKKLEEELGVKIFDREKQPVIPTEVGFLIIEQARKVLSASELIPELIQDQKKIISGHIRLGIIPTLAPYLLPLFLYSFLHKYPAVKLTVSELTTEKIIQQLKLGLLDTGILVTPLKEEGIQENILFYEEFVVYVSKNDRLYQKKYIIPEDIDINRLWLLEEGHCFRSQIMHLCELHRSSEFEKHFDYEAGSIETLKRFVEKNQGITLLPELATLDMPVSKKRMIRYFKSPAPVREVSLVTYRSFLKLRLIDNLKQEILSSLPSTLRKKNFKQVVEI
ncbi:MAG: hydrogen peroxide-inducible genes activator [Chitinophagaceae bacterium]